jgi:hypothetical protein
LKKLGRLEVEKEVEAKGDHIIEVDKETRVGHLETDKEGILEDIRIER